MRPLFLWFFVRFQSQCMKRLYFWLNFLICLPADAYIRALLSSPNFVFFSVNESKKELHLKHKNGALLCSRLITIPIIDAKFRPAFQSPRIGRQCRLPWNPFSSIGASSKTPHMIQSFMLFCRQSNWENSAMGVTFGLFHSRRVNHITLLFVWIFFQISMLRKIGL